ncbi:MAG: hypothetical protein R3Y64_04790 [Peptostreptococcaceae bacterium]
MKEFLLKDLLEEKISIHNLLEIHKTLGFVFTIKNGKCKKLKKEFKPS